MDRKISMYLKFDKIDLHIIILFSFLILFNFINYEINNYKLVGTWSGANDSITLSIKFNDDNSCNFSIRNNSDNVSNMYMGYYEIDNSKEPNLLNIKSIPNLNHGLYTIYKFNHQSHLLMEQFVDKMKIRPISFSVFGSINLYRTF